MADSFITPKRRYHVHTPLILYIGVSLLVAVGAFHSQNNLLFWLFGFSLGLMLVSGFISGSMLMGVRLERVSTPDARVGEPLTLRYRILNRSFIFPLMALSIREVPANGEHVKHRTWLGRLLHTRIGGPPAPAPKVTERRAVLSRPPMGFLSFIKRRGEGDISATALCLEPGRAAFTGIEVSTSFPFGIMLKSLYYEIPAACVVTPARAELELDLRALGRGTPIPSQESWQQPGAGDEFFALRDYNEGDSPRAVAWKRSAAQGRLLVMQTGGAAPGRLWVVLRVADGATSAEFDASVSVCCELISRGLALDLSTGLLAPQAGIDRPCRSTRAHALSLVETLSLLPRESLADASAASPQAFAPMRLHPGDKLLIVHAGTPDLRVGTRGATHVQAQRDDAGLAKGVRA